MPLHRRSFVGARRLQQPRCKDSDSTLASIHRAGSQSAKHRGLLAQQDQLDRSGGCDFFDDAVALVSAAETRLVTSDLPQEEDCDKRQEIEPVGAQAQGQ